MRPLAIHNDRKNMEWTQIWINYCVKNKVPHKIVNCFNTDILQHLSDCSGLLFLVSYQDPSDMLLFRKIILCIKRMGIPVYPDIDTCWHYDDKLGQKYLFEALGLNSVPSWAFYDKKSAKEFIAKAELPIVGKQTRGASGINVHLFKTRRQANKYIDRMFGRGFNALPAPWVDMSAKLKGAHKAGGMTGLINKIKRAPRFFSLVMKHALTGYRDRGYVYFQKFLPGNDCDVRISVVGDRAWGFRRMVRRGDFRASGSGNIIYDNIPEELIEPSFELADKLRMQSVGIDWIKNEEGKYQFVEVSMGFTDSAVYDCPGYWDRKLNWHEGHFSPAETILENMLQQLRG